MPAGRRVMTRAIRGLLFDKDGTLLDFEATWAGANLAVALAIAEGDRALAARLLVAGGADPGTGLTGHDCLLASGTAVEIAELWSPMLPPGRTGDLALLVESVFRAESTTTARAVTELGPLFRRLKARGLRLGVASSDSEQGIYETLAGCDVLAHIDFAAGYDSGFGTKPDPQAVLAFAERGGIAPVEVAVIGDNRRDLEMGRRAGAGLCVGVLSGTGGPEDLRDLADHLIESVAEIESLLDA